MAMNIAAEIGVLLKPIATGFIKRAKADIEAQNKTEIGIEVDADTKKASGTLDAWHARQSQRKLGYSLDIHVAKANAELEAFRQRQEGRRLKFGVDLDKKSVISLENDVKRVEHYYKGNPGRRAIRFQIYVAGAVALPALNQGILSVIASMTDLTRAGLLLPGMFSGIAASVATVTTGLQGISGALKASNDGLQNSAQYARQYAQATRELENAQRDVVNALKRANREIEDQKDKLAQGQLSVEQAQINVRRANQRMLEGGFSNLADYQQALLDVKRANLDLSIAVKENSRGIQDYYENASKGARGSDTYRDSLDKLSNSVDNFRKAQFQAAGMSEQFINAMKNLAPAGQDFVLEILKLRGAWKGLQDSIQTTLFKGVGDSITKLAQSQLPMLKTGMQNVAASINKDFRAILETLGRQANSNSMAKVFDNTARALEAMKPGIESVVTGFLRLSEVGSRFLPRLSLAFNKVMGRFERFVDLADKDGSLERWIDRGLKVISSLGRSFMNIGSIFSSLTTAYGRATGNIGGFAITVEKQLKKLADRYSSAAGQRGLIEWINQSKLFIQAIKDDLPGIRAFFHALGEGARFFATYFYPVLAGVGKLAEQLPSLTKFVVAFYIASKTLGPIGSAMGETFKKASVAAVRYKKNLAALKLEYVDAAKSMSAIDKVRKQALAIQADPKSSPQVIAAKAAHKEAGKAVKAAKAEVAAAQRELAATQASIAALPRKRRTLGLDVPDGRDQIAVRNAKAILREAAAQEALVEAQRQSRVLAGDVRAAQTRALGSATRTLAESADEAARAQTRLNAAARDATSDGPRGWMNRMKRGIGSGRGGGLIGSLAGLVTAFGGITAALGSAAVIGSVIYAINEYTNAKDRATMAADNMREAEDRLRTSLAKGTGSATGETLEANLSELGSYKLPARKNETIDAISILEAQAGIAPSEAASLALPTETKKREARLAPSDAKIIAAVPELDQWKKFGLRYRANGVDETVFGKALNGDPDSIAKVEAARLAIKDADPVGSALNLGAAVAIGAAPNDLGTAQQQLPTGKDGGLRGLSQAAGALRGLGRASAAAADKAQLSPLKQGGLNPRGQGLFSQFVLGPGGAQVLVDGSAVIEVDKYPDDVVRGWIESASPKGISVERRYPDGAIIRIDPENAGKYFNPVGKYAMGGAVWGAGTATSDSIPAMLSNGEFVINAKSASLIGHDRLNAMNSLRGYWAGGPVKRDGPGGGDGGFIGPSGSTNNYYPKVPIVTNAQTLPEAIGFPTKPLESLIGPAGAGMNNSTPSSITKGPQDLPGFIGSLGGGLGPKAIPNPPAAPKPQQGESSKAADQLADALTSAAISNYNPTAPKAKPPTSIVPHVGYGQPGPGGQKSTTGYPPMGPFTKPTAPAAGPSAAAGQSSGMGGRIGPGPNGAIYTPKWIGSGALQDTSGTAASSAPNAQINPNANILDYLIQVSNAYGLKPGSGPNDTEAGRAIADSLGIPTHFIDGGQHSVNRALDLGTAEQAEGGLITSFVKDWMSDPDKVAATRQLIFQDPKTGESFGIIQGRALFGQELQSVYGRDFPTHRDHVHMSLEGVPLDAFDQSTGLGAPISGIPTAPAVPSGPAASAPKGDDVQASAPGVIKGPFGDIPFDPISILKQIGAAILNGIFSFFGVDGSGFVSALFGLGEKIPGIGPGVEEIPQADPDLVAGLDAQIAEFEALGTPAGLDMAEKIRAGRDDYLKQFDSANAAASAESAAAYFDSIGQPDVAAKLRSGAKALTDDKTLTDDPFAAIRDDPGLSKWTGPSGAMVAPSANYSGGTPETHNAIYRAFREAGYPDSEWPSLVQLLNHENDTYDPKRPTGGPNSDASGIFQFLSTTWGEVGMEYSEDPYIQSVAGMRYIKKRYGTPTAAWNFWQNPSPPGPDPNWPHWYSTGGMVALARGGMVSGPGTGTSDSIPAMLSNGEFVMRADAVKHWGSDKLHAMNGFSEGGLVSNWWENTKSFGKGFVGAGKELITGIAPLVGLAGDGAPGVAESWKSMATGLAPLVGLGGANAPGVGEAWKELGKGAIRYDEWTGGNKAEAAGGNLFDILTAVLPGGALTKGIKSGELGAKTAQIAKNAGSAFTSPTAFADSLKLTPERRASLNDIPNVDLKGINPLAKRQALTAIADLHIKNPEIPISSVSSKGFSEISNLWGKKYASSVTAYADPADRSIVLNKAALNIPGGMFANIFSGFTNGSFRKSNIYALMAHEFGHLVDFHDNQSVDIGDIAAGFIEDFAKNKPEFLTQDGQLSFGGLQNAYQSKQFANSVLGALSGYSYKNAMHMVPRAIQNRLFPGSGFGIGGAALSRINLVEAKAEAFADVDMRGDKARPASKIINDAVLSSIAGQPLRSLPKILPGNPPPGMPSRITGRIVKPPRRGEDHPQSYGSTPSSMLKYPKMSEAFREEWDKSQIPVDPSIGPEMPIKNASGSAAGRAGGWGDVEGGRPISIGGAAQRSVNAPSYVRAKDWADKIWPHAIEDIGFNASRMLRDYGVPEGSPYSMKQLLELANYSKSSKVNKTLRGIEDLPGIQRNIEELLRVGKYMSGPGGKSNYPFSRFWETNAKGGIPLDMENPAAAENYLIGDNRYLEPGERPKRIDPEQLINDIAYAVNRSPEDFGMVGAGPFSGSTQQIWESILIAHLREGRRRMAAAIENIRAAHIIDTAFQMAPPLPKDMWVTRMVEPFGEKFEIGEWTKPNPGFSSSSLGVSTRRANPGRTEVRWEPSPVFDNREIMQQQLIRKGTEGIWFGGYENELLLPRGNQFRPEGMEDLSQENWYSDPMPRRIYGEAKFPDRLPRLNVPGLAEMHSLMRPMGSEITEGTPGWMDLLKAPSSNRSFGSGSAWSKFAIPGNHALEYANGGHVTGPGGPKSDLIPAMLSNGEFVMSAAATERIGAGRLMAMNKFAEGGPVLPPTGSSDPDAFKDLSKILTTPLVKPAPSGSSDPDAFKDLSAITPANIAGSVLSPKGGGGGASASAAAPKPKDPRSILGAAPTSDSHVNPALAGAIKGAFNTVGSIASTAASLAAAGATSGASAAIPGGSAAASALISAGTQMAGDVAVGAANVISSFLVGTVTPSQTGQGYGAPLLPQQQPGGGGNNFQSIHNGNVVTNNLSEYSRLKDRKDAQKAAPFFNRVNQ